MSAAFGGSRGLRPKPPEKGVFPLDHFGECEEFKTKYLLCLKENKQVGSKCLDVSKAYLECRMSKNLMAQQDLKELGLGDQDIKNAAATEEPKHNKVYEERLKQGFTAGIKK